MGRVPRVVRIATPIILAFMGATAIAQPANVSEAEDGHYALPAPRRAIPAISKPVEPSKVASAAEVDYLEPEPPKATAKTTSDPKSAPAQEANKPSPATDPTAATATTAESASEKGIFSITCYTLGGNTSSGHLTGPGVAAADWSILPNGTKISIEGIGEYTVRDRGPRGRTVDIWMSSIDECRKFGRKSRSVAVIG